ncbi:hypothetical protein BDP27DRAFT_1210936 [Rhodocollybia butyracea]|uniref:F-box domain-containing protein n=1 Tax=Rhodocollybia butyracea TaxID=206335 RepID=A0A9P5Q0W8_9AGAR|nr:hypothetical protein BDP27DRAFT_1210936 [Rhodocollybia butyracea]
MAPLILRDPNVTQKILEAIVDTPGGKRTLSRLARTCRAILEPALNVLWRDLDSFVPVIGLFPPTLLKKARKPGLGLSRAPAKEDWEKIMSYGMRVRSVTFNETANSVSPAIFPMLQNLPREYILPNLQQLTWKVETAGALDHCSMFLSPMVESLQFELGPTRFPTLNRILSDACNRLKLVNFSLVSPVSLPDTFTVMLSSQKTLQKVTLVAPGALSSGVGRWVAFLPELKSLQLDLSARTLTAIEGFFDELPSHTGDSTPSSVATTDSGVFSGEEVDFSSIRGKPTIRTKDRDSKAGFSTLHHVHLTGDVANIAVFLRHFSIPLTQLDLVIEDPPDNAEWLELSYIISERFGSSLQSWRISATATSKFTELIRSTSRAEPTISRLALEHLQPLPALRRLEIDLPESIHFISDDIETLAHACPNLEELKLCPLARFPVQSGPPKLLLEELSPLTEHCRNLNTISVPVNARRASPSVLDSAAVSSKSLRRLHVGHSWINDSLHVTILLSHLAPHLDSLKWFHDKNRPGFVETHARGWEKASETLPHIQNIRISERRTALAAVPIPVVELTPPPQKVDTTDKGIMAVASFVHQAVMAKPHTTDSGIQIRGPKMVHESVQVHPRLVSVSIDSVPRITEVGVSAIVSASDKSVGAVPETVTTFVDATPPNVSKSVQAMSSGRSGSISYYMLHPIFNLVSLTWRFFFAYPMSIPIRMLHVIFGHMPTIRRPSGFGPSSVNSISMNDIQVRG